MIKDITVVKGPEHKQLQLQIRWQGEATEVVELRLPADRPDVVRYPAASDRQSSRPGTRA